jgi:hypothetical protein
MDCWRPDDRNDRLPWWQAARLILALTVACWVFIVGIIVGAMG